MVVARDSPDSGWSGHRSGSGGILAPIVRASDRIVSTFYRVARIGWSAAAGILVPILIWIWPVTSVGGAVGILMLMLLLGLPGTVIHLVGRALTGVANLPFTIGSQATSNELPALSLKGGLRSIWSVGRYLMGIRGRLWAMRDELAAAGALLRLASLPVLISILIAALAVGLMVPTAALAILAVVITL
ncbi:MAG: hypothetical protein ACI9W4_000588 [Rhodothermales bacterium]|jgi:hypothetical protein